jgi:hypothetical protein
LVDLEDVQMNTLAIFGIGILMNFVSSATVAALFIWPRLRAVNRNEALLWLVVPHMFLRFIGLSFLVPGVVSVLLPKALAEPAAYGDFIAGILAIIATVALARKAAWAPAAAWIFNIWGAADLLFALYMGLHVNLEPGTLGAAYYIVTSIVPPLLVTHGLIFMLLLRRRTA